MVDSQKNGFLYCELFAILTAISTPTMCSTFSMTQGYTLSLTTVYRNLALLVQAGIIRRASIQEDASTGGVWYEHIWDHEHHDHLVCSHCGMKVEFSYPAIEILQEAVAKEHGFILESHHLELIGMCPDCRNIN